MRLIPRSLANEARPRAHWWMVAKQPFLSCPGCGAAFALRHHVSEIGADGSIGRYACPLSACNFDGAIKLDGYGEEVHG